MEKVKAVGGNGQTPLPPRPAALAAPDLSAASTAVPAWTAPTSVAPPPPPVPFAAPATSSSDPAAVLDGLVAAIDGVQDALLASVDGFGIAHSATMSDEPAHPAMLAAAVGLAHQLASMGSGEQLRQLVVEHDRGLVVIWPIGKQRVLAVLSATNVDQRSLRRAVNERVAVLSGGGRP